MTQGTGARPTGITILGVVSIIGGIFGVLGGLAALGLSVFFTASAQAAGGVLAVIALFALLVSIGSIVLGAGLLALKPWAWPVGVVLEALNAISAILGIASNSGIGSGIVSLVISGAIIWYLHQAHVRAAFGARATGFPLVGDRFDRYIPGPRS